MRRSKNSQSPQSEAEEIEDQDISRSLELRSRARRLYLWARRHALRGLENVHPGFTNQLHSDPRAAVRVLKPVDVPLVYWAAAAENEMPQQQRPAVAKNLKNLVLGHGRYLKSKA